MMLAPQFSLRRLLTWVTLSAFVCLIGAAAARGQLWAAGVLVAFLGLAITIALHGLTFAVVRFLSGVRDRNRRSRAKSAPIQAPEA